MPRQTLDIKTFQYGIFSRPDAQDIPLESASDSNNVDGDMLEGKLGGVPETQNTSLRTVGFDAINYAWIKRHSGSSVVWDLIYNTGDTSNTVKGITDFYGTPSAISALSSVINNNALSMVTQHQAVHIGVRSDQTAYLALAPYWVGWVGYGQFGSSIPGAIVPVTAELTIPTSSTNGDLYISSLTATGGGGTGVFDVNKVYEYTTSMVYDGFQESPLSAAIYPYTPSSTGNRDYIDINLIAYECNTDWKRKARVSACKVYRREKDTTTGNYTLWRLLGTLSITTITVGVDVTGTTEGGKTYTWTTSGGHKVTSLRDDNSFIGGTYEAETGMPETLTSSIVWYELGTELNNYLFVTRCLKSGIADASRYLFRSKSYRYNMFDWSNDYVVLPTIPLCIKAFAGRIFVWDENDTYIVNPDTLEIEDSITGAGCLSPRSVTITEYGMFWCDRKNAYHHDGRNFKIISEPIKSTDTTKDWHGFNKQYNLDSQALLFNYTPIVVFNAQKNIVLFIIPYATGSTSSVWAYNVIKNRWDKYESYVTTGSSSGAVVGRSGEIYWADGTTYLPQIMLGSSKKQFTWYSQNITFGDVSQKKGFYNLIVDYTGSTPSTLQYSIDNGSNWRNLTNTTEIKDAGGLWEKKKTLKIKIVGHSNGTTIVNNLGIVYRPMAGKRD